MNYYFVIQAQSIGLWGDPFAAGYVVVNERNETQEEDYFSCPPQNAKGLTEDREWVNINVLPNLPKQTNMQSTEDLCERVWQVWLKAKKKYSPLYCASYIGFPIVMNLFSNAIKPKAEERELEAPYPLMEIDTALLLTNYTISSKNHPRLDLEKPGFHSLCDAKYYARLFTLAYKKIQESGPSYEGISRPLCGLDAKSRGLWGGVFYFGSVLYSKENDEEKTSHRAWRNVKTIDGDQRDDVWRQPYEHTLPKGSDCATPTDLGNDIWKWLEFSKDAIYVSWCPFPVDYRALAEAIKVDPKRALKAPYPIHDSATALHLAEKDPIGNYQRRDGEEKNGDPRGSARLAIRLLLNI